MKYDFSSLVGGVVLSSNNNPDRVHSGLVLRGTTLNPDAITSLLEISPSRSFQRGDLRKNGKAWPHGYWELDTENNFESDNITEQIKWLVDRVLPHQDKFIELVQSEGIEARISCYSYCSEKHVEIDLDRETIKRMAALGLALYLDMYYSE